MKMEKPYVLIIETASHFVVLNPQLVCGTWPYRTSRDGFATVLQLPFIGGKSSNKS